MADSAPLIAHVIYRLDVGGLENGLVNLVNHIPPDRFRHAIICLTDYSDFRRRIRRSDVEFYALQKRDGHDFTLYLKLWRLLKRLRPAIVHTRNIAALEAVVPALLAGVPARIHGEHGWDVTDLGGANRKYRWLRRMLKPGVHSFIALSRDLEGYLRDKVRVPPERISLICNGVDTERFRPAGERESLPWEPSRDRSLFLMGTVGRMQAVKDHLNLVRAFLLLQGSPAAARLRLVIVGDGPQRQAAVELLRSAGLEDRAWLPGARDDIPAVLQGLDLFVLPSLAEGISNTILEAMASGLPVVATQVGGNPELVEPGRTGALVPPADPTALAAAIRNYLEDPVECRRQGWEARQTAERRFSLPVMVGNYLNVYERALPRGRGAPAQVLHTRP